jgi:hypothetical protein
MVISIANASYVVQKFRDRDYYEPSDVWSLIFGLVVVLLVCFVMLGIELRKGFGRKIPLPVSGEVSLGSFAPVYPSRLAEVFGVGRVHINWVRVAAFVIASEAWDVGAPPLNWAVRRLLHLDADLSFLPWVSILRDGLVVSVVYLIALRRLPNIWGVATVVGIVNAILLGLDTSFHVPGSELFSEFIFCLVPVVLLGLLVKKLRSEWMGLWVGTMAETVFVATLRWIKWNYLPVNRFSFHEGTRDIFAICVSGVLQAMIFASIFVLVVRLAERPMQNKQQMIDRAA